MLSIKPKVLYVRDQKTGKFIPLLAIRGDKGPPGSTIKKLLETRKFLSLKASQQH